MESNIARVAALVVSQTSREKPADTALRSVLRNQPGLARSDAARVSKAVFDYFRWFGWLNSANELQRQVEAASELAQSWQSSPQSFSAPELLEKCVPQWTKQELEITPELARSLQSPPKLWLRAKSGTGPALSRKLKNCAAFGEGALSDILEYRGRTDLFRTKEFQSGAFELQDLSSQAVGLICAPGRQQKWWDACTGEGGKMLHLSDLMANSGLIFATDRSQRRLAILKRRAARAKAFNYRFRVWDGTERLPSKTLFDGVLLDAPCSGVGTWQRNPHARWTTTLADIQELANIQVALAINAAKLVKPGGRLIYAVCTLTRSETLKVAEKLDAVLTDFKRLEIRSPLDKEKGAGDHLILYPQDHGGNGMFIATWQRR